jgi:hypothetical protein
VQDFLDGGGWLGLFAFIALLLLVWVWVTLRRLVRLFTRRGKKKKQPRTKAGDGSLKVNLTRLGDAYTDEGPRQVTVKGMPARLRLVVLSRGSRTAGDLTPHMADRVLDWIKPGLADVTTGDYPRICAWPLFYGYAGFATAFKTNVPIPQKKGEPSRWVLVTGRVTMGNAVLNIGLALYTEDETTLRHLEIKNEQWLDVLGVKDTRQLAGAR